MKNTDNNNNERKYSIVEKWAGKPATDARIDDLENELNRTRRNSTIAIVATAVVGAASTVGATMIVKKKCEVKYMTLPQIINLGKYAEYKELVNAIDRAMTAENEKKAIAEKSEATDTQKKEAAEATKARQEAEEKFDEFMRIDKKNDDKKKDKKEKKDKKKKNEDK